jgi:hypothetical protein
MKNSPISLALICLSLFVAVILTGFSSKAYTVSNFASEYHNGQIFLTWTTPNVNNLQYNVYRSTVPLLTSGQLTSSNFLGFVRDSSSKNIFWSQESGKKVFFKITDSGQPLASSQGLYIVSCTDNQLYYYVVTVTKLASNSEDKTILPGINSPLLPLSGPVKQPRPVWQDSIIVKNGEVKQLYVQFVNNQETSLYPAMNSTGSYGFNFYLTKRGSAAKYPLFILFEGFGDDATKSISLDSIYTNCYAMGVFDWLPIPQSDGSVGDNSFFCCWHEKFNIYSNSNPVPTSGILKTYPQKRYWQAIKWLESQVPIDTTRIYLKGTSANGFGALLTANLQPEKVAAVYSMVEPNTTGAASDITKQMWGASSSKLKTDVLKWNTPDTLAFTDLKDQQSMVSYNELRSMPVIYDVHGKKDKTIIWSANMIEWLDSLEANHIGGTWYWDQRTHTQDNKDFTSDETRPDFYRFATNISYPAFSNCSINQDPGNGNPANGDAYGAINGYLDWHDNNISDIECNYTIHLFIKDFYVGGVLDPQQYSTCKTDITFRRLQKFQPASGATIRWSNSDEVTGAKLQNGSFTYNGGLISIPNLTVNKTGTCVKLFIKNCGLRIGSSEGDEDPAIDPVYFSKSLNGYTAHVDVTENENTQVLVYDLMGRVVWEKSVTLAGGTNLIEIPAPSTGIFLVQLRCELFSHAEKLFF